MLPRYLNFIIKYHQTSALSFYGRVPISIRQPPKTRDAFKGRRTPEAQAALLRMIRFHVITETDRIEIHLLDRWIRERAIDL